MHLANYKNSQQQTHKQWFCVLILFCWLFSATIATVHAQKHLVSNDYNCQLCLSSANHTPIDIDNTFHIVHNPQVSVVIDLELSVVFINDSLTTSNRDPPSHYFL